MTDFSVPATPNEVTQRGTGPAQPKAADEGAFPTDDDAVLQRVYGCRKRADEELGDWFDDAKDDFDMYESRQWSQEDKDALDKQDRIPVTFNRVAAVVNAICGQEVANRQEVVYLPRRVGPVSGSSPMNDAVKWAREQCNAEDEDSDAFRDMTICGMGWTVLRMDYESDPEGRSEVVRRDPLSMRWDPAARRKNLADARWVQADYDMLREDIGSRWPDADMSGLALFGQGDKRAAPIDTTQNWKYESSSKSGKKGRDEFTVVHHVERRSVSRYRAVDPASGQMQEYGQSDYDAIQQNYQALPEEQRAAQPLPHFVPVKQRVYWEAWTVGPVVLQSGQAPAQKEFCYQCMTCYRERESGYWFGPVRLMRDPQRYANLYLSLMADILAAGAKGGMMYETGAFANPKKALADWARHNSSIELTQGSLGKVQPKELAVVPQSAADLMQFAIGSIRDVTGVNIELLGQVNSNETGVVEDMKTKAGLVILASVFDGMRLYRKRQAIVQAEYIERFISDGRLIRVLGPQGQQFVPLLRDPTTMEYDIVVDESPSSRDVKERTWGALQTILPLWMQGGMPPLPDFLDYAPVPQSLAMAMKQAMQQKGSQPPQPPPQLMVEQARQQGDQALEDQRHKNRMEELGMEAQIKAGSAQQEIFGQVGLKTVEHAHKTQQIAQVGEIDARLARLEAILGTAQTVVTKQAPHMPGPTPERVPRQFAQ